MDSLNREKLESLYNRSTSDSNIDDRTDKQLLIETLQELLELAENEELVGFVGIGYCENNNLMFIEDGKLEPYSVIGALDCLKTELVEDYHLFNLDQ